jgi:hypothetical protein
MARFERFTFLVNKKERELITALAERLNRSQSDAVRLVVTEAAKSLQNQRSNEQNNTQKDDEK